MSASSWQQGGQRLQGNIRRGALALVIDGDNKVLTVRKLFCVQRSLGDEGEELLLVSVTLEKFLPVSWNLDLKLRLSSSSCSPFIPCSTLGRV